MPSSILKPKIASSKLVLKHCPVGRVRNDESVVCRSCLRQGIPCPEKPGKKKRVKSEVRTWYYKDLIVTTKFLHGLNRWNNKNRENYVYEREAWKRIFKNVVMLWGKAEGKRYLQVKRIVANRQSLITDRDNLIGALKPLKDALTKQGVFIDDSDEFLTFDIDQGVDPSLPRVEIRVTNGY